MKTMELAVLKKTQNCGFIIILLAVSTFNSIQFVESQQDGILLSCEFDDSSCGFSQDTTDEFDWTRISGNTPSGGTGPSADHTTGKGSYMFIETSFPRRQGDKARLVSPTFTDQDTSTYCLQFFYHMFGEHIGDLSVMVVDAASKKHRLWQIKGNSGNKWTETSLDLPSSTHQLVFEATTGSAYRGDIAIDDVTVSKGTCKRKMSPHLPLATSIQKAGVCNSGHYGGRGFKKFSDKLLYKKYGAPNRIRLLHNDKSIYSILLGYGGHLLASRGGGGPVSGGRFPLEKLGQNEVITTVDINYDRVIRGLTFFTNTSRKIGPFGGGGSFQRRVKGRQLLYISGTEDEKHVVSLAFHFDSGCKEVRLLKSRYNSHVAASPKLLFDRQQLSLDHAAASSPDYFVHSIDRLSPKRTLNVELAVFVDSSYARRFYRHFGLAENEAALYDHIKHLLQKVQSWYIDPSLGYKLLLTLVKVVYFTPEQETFQNFSEFCQYQASFQAGGKNAKGSDIKWDSALYLTGKEGVFGRRANGKQIEGRASLGGNCNPTDMCSGAYHHFHRESYMVRLLAHEMAHTFGIRDDYQPPNNKRCRSGLMYNQHRGESFSKCSVEDLEKWLLSEKSLCLDNVPRNTTESLHLFDSTLPDTMGSIDGAWGQWGTWSACSRSCGGGVRRQRRECNAPSPIRGGRTCTGPRYKNSMCNTRPCYQETAVGQMSIFHKYGDECARKGFKRYAFPEIKGIYLEGTPRCQMMCTSPGASFYRYYTVTDGFSCSSTQNDVCVDGVCVERGCDNGSFESKARFDACGVCQGDGSSCKVYSGTYRGQFKGKKHVVRIPRRAYNIRINIKPSQHKDMEGNIIHLRTVLGFYLTNLKSRSETNIITYAGVTWEYIYDKYGAWTPHILRTKGPLTKEVDIYLERLWNAKPNLGVEYTYTLNRGFRRRWSTRWARW